MARKRKENVQIRGNRWYDKLSRQFSLLEENVGKIGKAYYNLEHLVNNVEDLEDYQSVITFTTNLKNNYRILTTLPETLGKYITGIRTISYGARKVDENNIIKDEDVLKQAKEASKLISGYKRSVEDILDDGRIFSGLTTKIDKLGYGINENNYERKKKKFSKDYTKIAKDLKSLFSRIEFIKGHNLKLGEAINVYPFEKLDQRLYVENNP
jgi:hypothetical protein